MEERYSERNSAEIFTAKNQIKYKTDAKINKKRELED